MESQVVIITGANSGIGLHMAEALLEQGHKVAGFDLHTDNLGELTAGRSDRLRIFAVDVTAQEEINEAVAHVIDEWGHIDILVNNAARCTFVPFTGSDMTCIKQEIDVNLLGYIRMIPAVLPHMQRRKRGAIYNVSSGVGLTGFPGISAYAASKGAVEAFSRSLALELESSGITVHIVHPPLTDTSSAAPLGIPKSFMANPATIGRKLAARLLSKKAVITAGFGASLGLHMSRFFPGLMGRMMANAARRARQP